MYNLKVYLPFLPFNQPFFWIITLSPLFWQRNYHLKYWLSKYFRILCWPSQLFTLSLETTKYKQSKDHWWKQREIQAIFLYFSIFMWNIWLEKCVFKCISIIMCKAKHWKVTSCWVVWTQANTCCLRRKTVLESPVALFIHIPLVKAKSDDCTVCHEIPCLGGFSQCYGFFPT